MQWRRRERKQITGDQGKLSLTLKPVKTWPVTNNYSKYWHLRTLSSKLCYYVDQFSPRNWRVRLICFTKHRNIARVHVNTTPTTQYGTQVLALLSLSLFPLRSRVQAQFPGATFTYVLGSCTLPSGIVCGSCGIIRLWIEILNGFPKWFSCCGTTCTTTTIPYPSIKVRQRFFDCT